MNCARDLHVPYLEVAFINMIPTEIDIDQLADNLRTEDVVTDASAAAEMSKEGKDKDALLQQFRETVDPAIHPQVAEKLGETKLVLLDADNLTLENSRDVAQAIKDRTQADTVIVQSRQSPGVVSDKLTRYNIENNQLQMSGSIEPAGTQTFINQATSANHHLGAVNALLLTLIVAAIAITAVSVWALNHSRLYSHSK